MGGGESGGLALGRAELGGGGAIRAREGCCGLGCDCSVTVGAVIGGGG